MTGRTVRKTWRAAARAIMPTMIWRARMTTERQKGKPSITGARTPL